MPRTILAVVDIADESTVRFSRIHLMAEMPLNHLGLKLRYWDIRQGLPPLDDPELRGILTWLSGEDLPDPVAFVQWIESALAAGLRYVTLGDLTGYVDAEGNPVPFPLVQRVSAKMGLQVEPAGIDITYNWAIESIDPAIVGFERPPPPALPAFHLVRAAAEATSHLTVNSRVSPGRSADLVVTGPTGGFVSPGFEIFLDAPSGRRQWILNPFEFFRLAFATDEVPKLDTTTRCGRRMYYSHIDGDGWLNVTEIQREEMKGLLSSEVMLREAIEPYPDLPITVAPVAADLDTTWNGTQEARDIASELFALPQVEAGSHTYTHPYEWRFFEDYTREKETSFLDGSRKGLERILGRDGEDQTTPEVELSDLYQVPRAYLDRPFDLRQEITGSARLIQDLLPEGKRVELFQWSGDTSPFEAALRGVREAGMRNLNGGDGRFDPDFPSFAHVSPVGIAVGDELQIYASSGNEMLYTEDWSDRFYGFRYQKHYVRNTGAPIRVKPFNVYYHMFSGQKRASVAAVVENLELARTLRLHPIEASEYPAIGAGFFEASIVQTGDQQWRIENRDGLHTIRFDRSAGSAVDFERSSGIVGQNHAQGSLYVALDPSVENPVLALRDRESLSKDPTAPRPYLVEARWDVWRLRVGGDFARCRVRGYGQGDMTWWVPDETPWRLRVRRGKDVVLDTTLEPVGHRIQLDLDLDGLTPLDLELRRVEES